MRKQRKEWVPNADKTCKKLPELSDSDWQRYHKFVDRRGPDECWPWIGGRARGGYGRFSIGSAKNKNHRTMIVARIAYMLHHGEDPSPLVVRHVVCNWPPCCNGAHLAKGTFKDNSQDAVKSGRIGHGETHGSHTKPERVARGERHRTKTHPELILKGENVGGAKLTDARVREVRQYIKDHPEVKQLELSKMFGIPLGNMHLIYHNKSWKHIVV